jgi:hypothetical protein
MKAIRLAAPFLTLLFGLLSTGVGCRRSGEEEPQAKGPPWFKDVTAEVGLDFVHDAGPLPKKHYFMPQSVGSGAALFDFDGDGLLDIYLLQNGGPRGAKNRLYKQLPDGRFKNVSAGSGLDIAGYNMGVAIGDVNNDGLPDVLVTRYGGVKLFLNNGDGTFTDVTRQAGLDNPFWGTSASFVDYNGDGWLDIVIVNYVDYDPTKGCSQAGMKEDYCSPKNFQGSVTKLYRNLGRRGKRKSVRFRDVTMFSGLGLRPGPGLGVVCADFTGHGRPDIFVANDLKANHLWVNRGDGKFTEEGIQRGIAFNGLGQPAANMGIALGDVDGTGRFAVFVTHLAEETHTLWKQEPRGRFQDRTVPAGLAGGHWRGTGFGTVLGDFDLDGALDLAIVNGRVNRKGDNSGDARGSFWAPYAELNQLFANDGHGHFRDVSLDNPAFCGTPAVARGLACGSLRNDGALDLLVTNVAGPARLYRNVAPRRGHWLLVRAIDPRYGGRDVYGAEITVRAGRQSWKRWLNSASSFLCSNDPRAHFGLGQVQRVDTIEVRWPDGKRETFAGRPADRLVVLRRGKGK